MSSGSINRPEESPAAARTGEASFSARTAKAIVDDLFGLNPAIYWADLLLTVTVTYSAIAVYLNAAPFSIAQCAAFVIAGFGIFRAATFMHEIVHMRKGHMRGFKLIWNLLVGIPTLTPSLFYTSHADHHSNRYYATPADGEYLPFGSTPPGEIVRFIATIPFVPVLAIIRALFLVPVSLFVPPLRRWLLSRASAAVISPTYHRRQVPDIYDPMWLACDLACFFYAAAFAILAARGAVAPATLLMLYLLIVFALTMNWVRTLAAHHYRGTGTEMSHTDQVLDSINITGNPLLTELLYPVGLRYHALHHLLPSLPYHALGIAHRRLVAELPADSPYNRCSYSGTLSAIRELWRAAAASGAEGAAVRQYWRQV